MVKTAFAVFLVIHGLIHLIGAAKAFGWADLPQLTQQITPIFGTLWLMAAVLFVGSAITLSGSSRGWAVLALGAVAVSITAIAPSWTDAKVGAVADLVVIAVVAASYLMPSPA